MTRDPIIVVLDDYVSERIMHLIEVLEVPLGPPPMEIVLRRESMPDFGPALLRELSEPPTIRGSRKRDWEQRNKKRSKRRIRP